MKYTRHRIFRRLSLNGRFVLLISVLLAAFCAVLTMVSIYSQEKIAQRRLVEKAQSMVSLLASTTPNSFVRLDIKRLRLLLADTISQEEVLYAYVLDEVGRVLTDGTSENRNRNRVLQDYFSKKSMAAQEELVQFDSDILDITKPVMLGERKLGGVRIGFSTRRMTLEMAALRNRDLAIGGCFLALGIILVMGLVRSVTRPLKTVIAGTKAVAQGNFDHSLHVEKEGEDELGILCDGFNEMLRQIRRRDQELGEVHRELLDAARQAGMAEVATNVLHNVGNVLNSLNVSTDIIEKKISESRVSHLADVVDLINQHQDDLGEFFAKHKKGKLIPGFLHQLVDHLADEQEEILGEIHSLEKNVKHINDIIRTQQSLAGSGSKPLQECSLKDLLEEAVHFSNITSKKYEINLVRQYDEIPLLKIEKAKLLQILVNLIANAKDALLEGRRFNKTLTLKLSLVDEQMVNITVSDNGPGIDPKDMTKIFAHGFTTKEDGHGFGLHSAFNAATEMGGKLMVHFMGLGKGATFIIQLPLSQEALVS